MTTPVEKSITLNEYLIGVRAAWDIGIKVVREAISIPTDDGSFDATLVENYQSAKTDDELLVNPALLANEVDVIMDLAFDSSCYRKFGMRVKLTELTEELMQNEAKEYMDREHNRSTFEPNGGFDAQRIVSASVAADDHMEAMLVEDAIDDIGVIPMLCDIPLDDEETASSESAPNGITQVDLTSGDSFLVMDGKIALACNEFESDATQDMYAESCALIARAASAGGISFKQINYEAPSYCEGDFTKKDRAYIEVAVALGLIEPAENTQDPRP